MSEALFDILETCLGELENGADLEAVLARYPKFAAELKPMLESARAARQISAPQPPRAAVTRGRAKLMQRVSELREEKSAPRKRVIPLFQRLAISFAMTAVFLLSGTGLVSASSNALPGQNLYPVKRKWEDLRLFFAFDAVTRKSIEDELKEERRQEASELLSEGDQYEVEFSGALTIVNGNAFVAEMPVVFAPGLPLPAAGSVIEVKGRTTAQGYVEAFSFEYEDGGEQEKNSAPALDAQGQNDSGKSSDDENKEDKDKSGDEEKEDQ